MHVHQVAKDQITGEDVARAPQHAAGQLHVHAVGEAMAYHHGVVGECADRLTLQVVQHRQGRVAAVDQQAIAVGHQ